MMYYKGDLDYAHKRLSGTALLTNDKKFVMVHKVVNTMEGLVKAVVEDLSTEDREVKSIPLDDLDLTPIDLGYFDFKNKAYFSMRKPMRQDWRQGLSQKSLYVHEADTTFNFLNLVQPVFNDYGNTEQIVEHVLAHKGNIGRAISRDFALRKIDSKVTIFYRIYPVGFVEKEKFKLFPEKGFLEDHLKESMRM